ncbi:MAG: shikimate kinase [Saprospiraceae bacterium]|nr:shikimate kinase [Saprospiraceae bacterium]
MNIKKYDKIYLTGFMGSGKSFLAQNLAKKTGWQAKDLDQIIEEGQNLPISAIFQLHGEAIFRKLEQKALHNTLHASRSIFALGGGTTCFFDNMDWIKKHGICIFLNPSVATLVERLSQASELKKRPLLQQLNSDELELYISNKLEERMVYYKQANYTIISSKLEEIIKEIEHLFY